MAPAIGNQAESLYCLPQPKNDRSPDIFYIHTWDSDLDRFLSLFIAGFIGIDLLAYSGVVPLCLRHVFDPQRAAVCPINN